MSRAPGRYDGLTARQADLLSFLRIEADRGRTPSYDEMVEHLGLASKSGVHRLISGLKERGYIEQPAYRARAIVCLDRTPRPLACHNTDVLIAEMQRRGFRFFGKSAEAA